jgi:hypothetical protein
MQMDNNEDEMMQMPPPPPPPSMNDDAEIDEDEENQVQDNPLNQLDLNRLLDLIAPQCAYSTLMMRRMR